jgi:TPR repeat protein
MPMFSTSALGSALAAFIVLTPAGLGAADEQPPYESATQAYRQGVSALKTGEVTAALPALEYAAGRGVLGAQLKLARLYAAGRQVPKDDARAFYYFQKIADQYADIPPSSPIAKYVGESFVALGQYYVNGIEGMPLRPDPVNATGLFRQASAYFSNAEAQYRLGRLYLAGAGVEKNPTIAANWLAIAARKQHPGAQALLGQMLWQGDGVSQRPARGLALLTLAEENAKAKGRERDWISKMYVDTLAQADSATRKEAKALLPKLGGPARATATARVRTPVTQTSNKPALSASKDPQLGPVDLTPPAAMGMSMGFGASDDGLSLQP